MRGVAPLLVAWWAGSGSAERLSREHLGGVLLICGGVLSLGIAGGRRSQAAGKNAAAATALGARQRVDHLPSTRSSDGAGVRVSGGAERYVDLAVSCSSGLPFGLAVLALKRGVFLRHAARHWWRGMAGADLSGLSYGIALWAMTRAPVAIIAALRETSVIFAALIGAWLLKEGHLGSSLAGATAVLAGLIALKL